jgi:hypothetical protein
MFYYHSALMLLDVSSRTGIFEILYQLVPVCPAVFLFTVGYSLTISWQKRKANRIKWALHIVKRGLLLMLAGAFLFIMEHGFQIPDLLAAPGILYTIGLSIIVLGLMLLVPFPTVAVAILTTLYTALTLYLLSGGIKLFPLTTGYEPQTPTILFAMNGTLIGLLASRLRNTRIKTRILFSIATLSIAILTLLTFRFGFMELFDQSSSRYIIERSFNRNLGIYQLVTGNSVPWPWYSSSVWNYDIPAFFSSLLVVISLFSLGLLAEPFLQRLQIDSLLLPGRYALINYFFHFLVIIALLNFLPGVPLGKVAFCCVLAGLLTASYLVSWRFDTVKKLRRGN